MPPPPVVLFSSSLQPANVANAAKAANINVLIFIRIKKLLGLFMQISSFLLLIYSKGIVANIEIYFESA